MAMTAREYLASGNEWTNKMAREALPILLWVVKNHRTITYKQLAEEMSYRTGDPVKARMTLYGKPAGKIGDVLILLAKEKKLDIPPLNAIVVNARTKLPGHGATYFIKRLLRTRRNLSDDADALAQAAVDAVLNYSEWDTVARELGVEELPPVKIPRDTVPESEPIKRPAPSPRSGAYPESPQHKTLKVWAVNHPKFFGKYGNFGIGKNEERLESGDSLDAYPCNQCTRLAIEVKASNAPDSEVFRGIFQCVKYRATLRAMQLADSAVPNANAVLLLTRDVPPEAKRLAKRLQVNILKAPAGVDRG